jgi:hypothetical protein
MHIEGKEQTQIRALKKLRDAYRTLYHARTHSTEYLDLFAAVQDVLSLGLPAPREEAPKPPARKCIVLEKVEVQSGMTRVKWAENLIRQLLNAAGGQHDGAASWLLKYEGDKTVITELPEPEVGGTCSSGPGEIVVEELPYRRAMQLTAYSPNEVTRGFYAALAEDGTMWMLPWDEFTWQQIPCLPNGAIDL